jgi:predicted transcriptional regulator
MQYEKILSSTDEIKTFSDPFRVKILLSFGEAEEPLTVKQISVKLGEVPAKVHYHVKELERIGVLELVATKEKSGILEKYYLPTAQNFRIDKSLNTTKGEKTEFNSLGSAVMGSLMEEYNNFIKYSNHDSNDIKAQMGIVFLTDAELKELDNMIYKYIKERKHGEDAKPYVHGHFIFRKYDETGGK